MKEHCQMGALTMVLIMDFYIWTCATCKNGTHSKTCSCSVSDIIVSLSPLQMSLFVAKVVLNFIQLEWSVLI